MSGMQICTYLWVVFLIVWVIRGMRTKPVQTREGVSSRLSYTVLTIAAAYLMFSAEVPREWLRRPIFPANLWIEALGISITAAGIAFAFWARAYLGGNWSGAVTVKVGHELVRTGPYRWVRHPIYSGMIFAMFGTALNRGQLRGLIAVVLLYLGFKIKSKIEESVMISTFGAQYDAYRRNTGAIVPKLHF
jgi:protein-S-isoprenylcysteine O-methyltransferase Ste14